MATDQLSSKISEATNTLGALFQSVTGTSQSVDDVWQAASSKVRNRQVAR